MPDVTPSHPIGQPNAADAADPEVARFGVDGVDGVNRRFGIDGAFGIDTQSPSDGEVQ
jgi:hypothetical protein